MLFAMLILLAGQVNRNAFVYAIFQASRLAAARGAGLASVQHIPGVADGVFNRDAKAGPG